MATRHVLLLAVLWAAAPNSGSAAASRSARDTVSRRFDRLEERFGRIETRLNAGSFTLDSLDARLDAASARLSSGDNELSSRVYELATRIDSRLDNVSSRVDSGDNEVRSRLDELATRVDSRLDNVVSQVDDVSSRLDNVFSQVDDVVSRVDKLASRVEALVMNQTDDQGQARRVDPRSQLHPRDCSELPPGSRSGVHLLQPGLDVSDPPVAVGGDWTVIQRRGDIKPREDFNRTWAAYREGFGRLDQEFWWGLESLRRLTGPRDCLYELKVELADFDDGHRHALYGEFRVASKADNYRLTVTGYSGTAGDSLGAHNGSPFSTTDRDRDRSLRHCAQLFGGGWWFGNCYDSHLNGPYLSGKRERHGGVNWASWKGTKYSLKETEMKLRPVNTE